MKTLALLLCVQDSTEVEFVREPGRLELRSAGRALGSYVYEDRAIRRPFLAHLRAPDGTPITRNHPPIEGRDATDHADMHPGAWLGFGSLGGEDFWRNKAKVEHVRFVEEPKRGSFTVLNRYASADRVVCEEACRITAVLRPAGLLLVLDSAFSGPAPFAFGDQEEMGFGIRLATGITVKAGGRMTDSAGRRNEKGIWGKPGEWCDAGGLVDGRRTGALVVADAANPAPSRLHARDYGLLVFNPFGRKAFGAGEAARTEVKKGDTLRLRFALLLYRTADGSDLDAAREARSIQDFLKELKRP